MGGALPDLSSKDALAALRFSREAGTYPDLASFRAGVLEGLPQLVPCDLIGYNEVDLETGTSTIITDPPGVPVDGAEGLLARLAHQHPLIGRQLAGDMRTRTISDFLTERRYHSLELYHELYRPIEAEDQIAFGLPGRIVVGIAMNRSRRSFSARDRALLEAVRPSLTQAWRQSRARERARALIRALEQGLETIGGAVVLIGPSGAPADFSDGARELLEAYAAAPARPGLLPEPVTAWLSDRTTGHPLTLAGPRGRLLLQRLGPVEDGGTTLLLSEARRARPTAAALLTLGVTTRQAEVLCLLAAGRDNAAIAAQLGVTVATVRKHLERIYETLGVHSRTDAARVALDAC